MNNTLKKYHGRIDLNVANNSHTQAFIFLKEHCDNNKISSPRVLEIGCSSGYFSSALKDQGFYVYGVEPFTDEAKREGLLDDFFYGPVEEFYNRAETHLYGSFDAIILGDVLEHLIDPENTLIKLSKFLNSEGVVIASLPNITHIGIQRMLADSQWMYQKYGILDSTHLKFFSWSSVNELFIKAGFGINRRYNVLIPEFKVYPSASSAITFANNSPLNPEMHTFQFVIRASKKSLVKKAYIDTHPKNILIISPNPYSSLTILRLIKPLSAFVSKFGGHLAALKHTECMIEHIAWADVLIVHREISIYTAELLREARRLGIPIVYDIDDLLTELPEWSQSKISKVDKTLMEYTMSTANCVTCTSKCLQQELNKFSNHVKIIPNVIINNNTNIEHIQKQNSNECTLVIASSDTVIIDFIIEPVKMLCKSIPNLKIITIGLISYAFRNIPAHSEQYPQCSPEEFSHILNRINNGIGLIPLDNSVFSSCKSPIKYFHYTSCGIVTIASAVKPYTEHIEHGVNGILSDNTTECWVNTTTRLINDVKLRQLLLIKATRSWQKHGSKEIAISSWRNAFYGLPKAEHK